MTHNGNDGLFARPAASGAPGQEWQGTPVPTPSPHAPQTTRQSPPAPSDYAGAPPPPGAYAEAARPAEPVIAIPPPPSGGGFRPPPAVAYPPPPLAYGHGYPPTYGPGIDSKNWMGILSLILSIGTLLTGITWIGGIIFGHMGLAAAKRGEASNREVALAGVIVGLGLLCCLRGRRRVVSPFPFRHRERPVSLISRAACMPYTGVDRNVTYATPNRSACQPPHN